MISTGILIGAEGVCALIHCVSTFWLTDWLTDWKIQSRSANHSTVTFSVVWKEAILGHVVDIIWCCITFPWNSVSCSYTGCNRRNGPDFGRVFLMLNYTDLTQNNYIQSWTVTEIMAIEMCGLLGFRRTVRRPWRHTCPMRQPAET